MHCRGVCPEHDSSLCCSLKLSALAGVAGSGPGTTSNPWLMAALFCTLLCGLQVYLASQCHLGPLKPELYKSGALALEMGVEAGPQMTPECAVVKMMLCLAYPDIALGQPLAGEL